MWTTLALAATLSFAPAQQAKPTLTNARFTFGLLGMERPDNKFLPADNVFLLFDVENLKVDAGGKVKYQMAMEVLDSANKEHLGQKPRDLEAIPYLGGNRLASEAHIELGINFKPGLYTIRLTVTDLQTKAVGTLDKKFEVIKLDFGIVRFVTTYDEKMAIPAPALGVPGQLLNVHFVLVGFERDKNKKPNLNIDLKILDDKGKDTLPKAFGLPVKDWPETVSGVDIHFPLALTRAGKFTIEILAEDKISNKKTTFKCPLNVISTK